MGCVPWWGRFALEEKATNGWLSRVGTKRRHSRSLRRRLFLESLERRVLLSFGITSSGGNYSVDTGGGLVFTVLQHGTSSTIHSGDITSITLNGIQLLAPYSRTLRYSHYEEGLSNTATLIVSQDLVAGWAMIAATDSSLGVTQYYAVRNGDNIIYMATYAGGASPPSPGEMRFLFYLDRTKFNVDPNSDVNGKSVIEGSDVFADPATGYTYSKFYSSQRNIDDAYHGVTGPGLGAFMMIGSREKGSGGPFFKDIVFQGTSGAEELYNYMYSGHEQTEAFRPGLQGPYALEITDGSDPVPVDYSFMDNLGITGWVTADGRGAVSGTASGVSGNDTVTVALSNAAAQYWTYADPASGAYEIDGVLPGPYTETLYANELAVGSQTVTIAAGQATPADIQASHAFLTPIWQIGTWDGTPNEFFNEPALNTEHPSDSRMMPWNNVSFVVGTNVDSDWPAAQWKAVNNDNQIVFDLTPEQAAVANTLRIGITDAFAGGRPYIAVNAGQPYQWTSSLPSSSSQPNSRSITRGTYRGNNHTFTYNIPLGKLVAGTNTIDIHVNSGSGSSGFLSAAIVYDAIDLVAASGLPGAGPPPSITRWGIPTALLLDGSLASLMSAPLPSTTGLIASPLPARSFSLLDIPLSDVPAAAETASGHAPSPSRMEGLSSTMASMEGAAAAADDGSTWRSTAWGMWLAECEIDRGGLSTQFWLNPSA